MNKERGSLKEEAQQALIRREWTRALEVLQRHCAQEPEDLRSRLKIADLFERLGQKMEAIQVYQEVAEAYARDGFLQQAISVNKMILRIDSSSQDANDRLVKLYAAKTRKGTAPQSFRNVSLFSGLGEEELESIVGVLEAEYFKKDATICREREEGDSLFIIGRGEVAITKQIPGAGEVWVRTLREGDFFGEFGFFTDQVRHATARAASECDILKITRGRLDEIIKVYPRLGEVLQSFFKKRVLDLFLVLSPLFSTLTLAEREEISRRFRLRKIPEETLLFKEGDPPLALYMVKSGEVEVYSGNRQGKRVRLATLRGGNLFGEISVLFNKPRMASARTTRSSELLELTREELETCLLQLPELRSKLKKIASNRLAHTKEILSQEEIEKVRETLV
jgi:cAMP-dependent protein kinase regulator